MEDVGVLYAHLVAPPAIWYILWPFGIHTSPILVYFFPFWFVVPRKIWQTYKAGIVLRAH
jgi:hypothetical protein